jgi:hypothetical protein
MKAMEGKTSRRSARFKAHLVMVVGATVLAFAWTPISAHGSGEPSFSSNGPIVFGFVPLGAASAPMPVIVSNTGAGALDITAVAAQDTDPHADDPHDFSVASDGCTGASLGPGESCTVQVVFRPIKEGTRVAVLAFSDNRSSCGNYVTLAGSSTVSLSPAAVAADCIPAQTTVSSPRMPSSSGVEGQHTEVTSTAKCASRRVVEIHLQRVRGERVTVAEVYVNGKRTRVLHRFEIRVIRVSLRGLPKARYEVRVKLRTATGRKLVTRRAFLTCVQRRA